MLSPTPSPSSHPPLPWRALRHALGWLAIALDHAKPIRIALLILLLGGAVALGVAQAAELFLITLWIDPAPTMYVWLLAGCLMNGLAVWYAARQAYRLVYPRWPALEIPAAQWLRDWLPRVMGAAVPLLVLAGYLAALRGLPDGACAVTGGCVRRGLRASGLVVEAAAMIGFFVARRPLVHAWARRRGVPSKLALTPALEPRVHHLRTLGPVPLRLFLAAIGLNVACTVGVAWWPQALVGMGPLAILLIAASFMCVSGGFVCMAADRRGVPVISLLLAVSVLLHVLHLNDNHRVRQYPSMSTHQRPDAPPPDGRPDFDAYARAWLDDRCAGHTVCPVLLAAAEGGGIRGAAWTDLVLARLSARLDALAPRPGGPLLPRYLFAASGVSGGSLGLGAFVAQLPGRPAATLEARGRALLAHDFLAPTLANMLFVDFTQRWLPGAWFDDRSRALTRAWESAAREQGVEAFAQPLAAPYGTAARPRTELPALFLNSTTVGDGRRFVQHPFRPLATPQRQPWLAALDGSAWLDPRAPLSEVILNSARFSYVSAAGTLQAGGSTPPLPPTLQLVDGGYYENSGATTLLEVLEQLRRVAASRGQRVRVIVLHISNDPSLTDFVDNHDPSHLLPAYSALCPAASPHPPPVRGDASAPLDALLATREARGAYARAQLLGALHPAAGDALWHFRLCPGRYPIPLGWTISAPVFDELGRQLTGGYPLDAMAVALRDALAPPRVAAAATPTR